MGCGNLGGVCVNVVLLQGKFQRNRGAIDHSINLNGNFQLQVIHSTLVQNGSNLDRNRISVGTILNGHMVSTGGNIAANTQGCICSRISTRDSNAETAGSFAIAIRCSHCKSGAGSRALAQHNTDRAANLNFNSVQCSIGSNIRTLSRQHHSFVFNHSRFLRHIVLRKCCDRQNTQEHDSYQRQADPLLHTELILSFLSTIHNRSSYLISFTAYRSRRYVTLVYTFPYGNNYHLNNSTLTIFFKLFLSRMCCIGNFHICCTVAGNFYPQASFSRPHCRPLRFNLSQHFWCRFVLFGL